MKSLLNILEESISKTNLGLRRRVWRRLFYDNTHGQYVDLLEINGKGVVDFIKLVNDQSVSDCGFRITCDDKVWEWTTNKNKWCLIFSEQAIYGAGQGSSDEFLTIPYLDNNGEITTTNINNVKIIDVDSFADIPDSYNLLTGGFRFENTFKISAMNYGYNASASALYRIY